MDFEAFIQELERQQLRVHGIAVYEDGTLTHQFGDIRNKRYPIYSATKTILALAVGIASDRGLIDIGRSVLTYLPETYTDEMSPEQKDCFQGLTVHRLMTMSVEGFPFRAEGGSFLRFALSCPIAEPKKRQFSYSNIPAYLVGVALAGAIGGDVWEFLKTELLRPLGIGDVPYTRCPDGFFYGASGMELTVEELSRIGMLVYNRGVHDGNRIVSEAYIKRMSATLIPSREGGYGYLMWRFHDGNRISGKWGQRCYILPARGLMITVLSDMPERSDALDTCVERFLCPEPAPTGKTETEAVDKPCRYAGRCGGCDYQGIPYEEQLKRKQKRVRILLDSFGKIDRIIGAEQPTGYRNKVHGVFGRDRKGNIFTGIYEEKSHSIVPVQNCGIENPVATAILQTLCELAKSFKIRIYDEDLGTGLLRHALLRVGRNTGEVMVVLVVTDPVFPSKQNFVRELRRRHPEITTVVLNINSRDTSMVLGERNIVLYGSGYIEDVLCGLRFRISPSSFYQIHPEQTEVLYGLALKLAGLTGKERVIDAYCGIGTIGMCAARQAAEVIGVELNRDAVRDAVYNARANKIRNIIFQNEDAGEYMLRCAAAGDRADLVIMDPPRSGSTPEFIRAVNTLAPAKVIYISCNPETLRRDLLLFGKLGWKASSIQPLDMFPYTEHVETVVGLQRTNT